MINFLAFMSMLLFVILGIQAVATSGHQAALCGFAAFWPGYLLLREIL